MSREASSRRIALVVPGFAADRDDSCIPVLSRYAEELAQHREVIIYTAGWPFERRSYRLYGATVHSLADRGNTRLQRLLAWRRVEKLIVEHGRKNRFDLIHAFWATAPGLAAVRSADRLGLPSVVSIAGGELVADRQAAYGSLLSPISRRVVHRVIKAADHLTLGSHYLRTLLPKQYHHKAEVLPLGFDVAGFTHEDRRDDRPDPIRVLAVSAMIAVKDYPTMIRAVHALRERGRDVRFTAVGWHGNAEEHRRVTGLVSELGLGDIVEIRGTVDHVTMPEVYRAHDILLHASRHEAQGMAILEALASGLPVVSTPVGLAPELAEKRVVSLVDIDDVGGIVDAILEVTRGRRERIVSRAEAIAGDFEVAERTAAFVAKYRTVQGNHV